MIYDINNNFYIDVSKIRANQFWTTLSKITSPVLFFLDFGKHLKSLKKPLVQHNFLQCIALNTPEFMLHNYSFSASCNMKYSNYPKNKYIFI